VCVCVCVCVCDDLCVCLLLIIIFVECVVGTYRVDDDVQRAARLPASEVASDVPRVLYGLLSAHDHTWVLYGLLSTHEHT
jgi:hypothetical protein